MLLSRGGQRLISHTESVVMAKAIYGHLFQTMRRVQDAFNTVQSTKVEQQDG